jgi:hypothetical protein
MNQMTCREFDEIVHAYVRMELLDVRLREAALEHAAECSLCANRMAEAVSLAEASEEESNRVHDLQTPPQVLATVLAEFRHHHARSSWRRTLVWSSMGAVAAVLLIVFWVAGVRSNGPAQPSPRKDVSSQPTGPVDVMAPAPEPLNEDAQGAEEEVADASASDAATGVTYVASDFVPVPFTSAFGADDPGMVVRVELTRASLAQLGYPLATAADDDLVQADVLVGEDGWPRGVKLVQ